nr:hypothetical protein [Rubrivivax pictus]
MTTGRAFVAPQAAQTPAPRDVWIAIEALTRDASPVALRPGAPRGARLTWETLPDLRLKPVITPEPHASVLITTDPAWYIDAEAAAAGPLDLAWPAPAVADLLEMPPIETAEASLVGAVLRDVAPDLPLPPSQGTPAAREIGAEPIPVLTFATQSAYAWGWQSSGLHGGALDFATASFDYGGVSVEAHGRTTLCRSSEQKPRIGSRSSAHCARRIGLALASGHGRDRRSDIAPFLIGQHLHPKHRVLANEVRRQQAVVLLQQGGTTLRGSRHTLFE